MGKIPKFKRFLTLFKKKKNHKFGMSTVVYRHLTSVTLHQFFYFLSIVQRWLAKLGTYVRGTLTKPEAFQAVITDFKQFHLLIISYL